MVESGNLLGDRRGMAQRQQVDGGAEPDARRDGAEGGQSNEWIGHGDVPEDVVSDPRLGSDAPRLAGFHGLAAVPLFSAGRTLGVVEVAGGQDRTVQARIIYACDAINKGDRVAPFALAPFPADKVAQPTTRQVEGTIVDSARGIQIYGLQHVVFLDVGEVQGIAPGDIFAIYRPNLPAANPSTGQVFAIAPDRRGEAVVIRVTDRAATAVLSASGKEIQSGDRVVLSRQVQP